MKKYGVVEIGLHTLLNSAPGDGG